MLVWLPAVGPVSTAMCTNMRIADGAMPLRTILINIYISHASHASAVTPRISVLTSRVSTTHFVMHTFTALFPFDGIFDVLCRSSFRLLVTLTIYQSSNYMWIWAYLWIVRVLMLDTGIRNPRLIRCVRTCVCMHVCDAIHLMCACTHVCMYASMHTCSMYATDNKICMCAVFMHVCTRACIRRCFCASLDASVCTFVRAYACIYIYIIRTSCIHTYDVQAYS
jgi:hypothetical protein